MKDKFFAFIKPKEQEFEELWKSCIFTFDANILLNFYRYKSETTNTFFDLLDNFSDRVMLTYQAGTEYFENRLDVISEQEKAYSEVRVSIEKHVEDPLQSQKKHPHISPELYAELAAVTEKVKNELDKRSKEYSQRISQDDILDKIISIFQGKISEAFPDERLDEIYIEGDKRYSENIPPGFKDQNKGGIRRFGDLVLWYQMIEIAKEKETDLIFITDDEKEDWLYIHKGKTISPLPALQYEFFNLTGRKFYIYTAYRFIEYASKLLQKAVSEEAIEEVKNFQEESKIATALEEKDHDFTHEADGLLDEEIDYYLTTAIKSVENESGWAELAPLGLYLLRRTPIDYRKLGFQSLRKFIESRDLYEVKALQKSPNAKNVDTIYVRSKEIGD